MIVFTGAGTGGHVLTAISVIERLRELDPNIPIKFIGSINLQKGRWGQPSIDEILCKRYGIDYVKIRTGKVQRYIEPRTFKLLGYIPLGFWDSFVQIRKLKPKIVIGFGGFTTPPVTFWGRALGAKVFVHEQTLSPGLANRVAALWAHRVLTSFPPELTQFSLRIKKKLIHTGYPVRRIFNITTFNKLVKHIESLPKEQKQVYTKQYLEGLKFFEDKKYLLVLGGGLGSAVLNEFVLQNLEYFAKKTYLFVQTGRSEYFDKLKEAVGKLPKTLRKKVIVKDFLYEEMGYVLSNAGVVLSRSGAGFTYQIGMLGKKAILVPLPFSRGDEQLKNAKLLEQLGLGYVLPQSSLSLPNFEKAYKAVVASKPKLAEIKKIFIKNADYRIAKLLLDEYNKK